MENKVTEEGIKLKIKDVKYTVLEDRKTTIANVYLENGFTVRGESCCVDPGNYDVEMGKRIAYENAFEKIWELEGYLLAQRLYETEKDSTTYLDRLMIEYIDLTQKANKLADFIQSDEIEKLPVNEINLLSLQLEAMDHYRTILLIRMNNNGIDISKFTNTVGRKVSIHKEV